MPEVQDILTQYGAAYRQGHKLSLVQLKAMNAIQNCRTAHLGGHMDYCPECGYTKPSYNSCRNRHCPKCQTLAKERWIDARKADLLDVSYFHVVFTVPQELNSLIHRNQRDCYNLLFRCVAETLQELAKDKKYLGATIGHTAILHTRGQSLCFHPHIHCIVPSGGLTALGRWQASRKKFFLPVRVLSRKFRGKFLALLNLQFPDVDQNLLNVCYRKEWVVYCKPPFKDAACVVEYLGRYTHRVAISNNRILKLENGVVTFKWRDYRDSSHWKEMTLSAEEFIRRFLMHVLPSSFTKIRHYGFLSSRGKQKKLRICKLQTGTKLIPKEKLSAEQLIQKLIGRKPSQCPRCGYSGLLRTGLSPPAV
ncbi:IS91 family transposase [Acetanaerobacterium elongatum]|uniref:Transposase zinc-binding domain-containing protein n=1 Tax=Acetanaerobacterium elongatum TaxID=258515 RepID=A0A1G9WPJ6_9FIRM|nr:IS91 family transposase [Acetanaerobacterium elongatum]SDM86418.1 Transposase zinc-binding domain-containing protein [Acetanaerobacterium elongatum]